MYKEYCVLCKIITFLRLFVIGKDKSMTYRSRINTYTSNHLICGAGYNSWYTILG